MAGKKKERTVKDVSTELPLTVTVRDNLEDGASLGLGLRMNMLEVGDPKTDEHGSLTTGSGLGNDAIIMRWRGREAVLFGRDLFKAWVATFAPADAARLP